MASRGSGARNLTKYGNRPPCIGGAIMSTGGGEEIDGGASSTSEPPWRGGKRKAKMGRPLGVAKGLNLSCWQADVFENKPRTLFAQSESSATGEIEPAQVRRVAQRIHACGPRAAFEFVADLARGRDFAETLADFGRLDPAIYAAVVALVCDGGHA